jgi:hypothetical protein
MWAKAHVGCRLFREKIARCIGGEIDTRTASDDVGKLVAHRMIEVAGSASDQVVVLGMWELKEGLYIEYWYLEGITADGGIPATCCVGSRRSGDPGITVQAPLQQLAARWQDCT